jgi:hypothetical protein
MPSLRVHLVAEALGGIDQSLLRSLDRKSYDFQPNSVAFPVQLEALNKLELTLVVAGSYVLDAVALMICRIADTGTALVIANALVRELTQTSGPYSTLVLPESVSDLSLEHTDPDFFCDRFLCALPEDFGIFLPAGFRAQFLVGSDDNVEGELQGEELLRAIQERTPLGISPPGIDQPFEQRTSADARVVVRKANR